MQRRNVSCSVITTIQLVQTIAVAWCAFPTRDGDTEALWIPYISGRTLGVSSLNHNDNDNTE